MKLTEKNYWYDHKEYRMKLDKEGIYIGTNSNSIFLDAKTLEMILKQYKKIKWGKDND